MSDDAEAGDGEVEEAGEQRKRGGKKLILMIVLPLLLLAGGGAGVYFSGLLDPLLGVPPEDGAENAAGNPVPEGPGHYLELDEMLVTLNSPGRRQSFLKMRVSLELETEKDEARIVAVMPRIVDNFQVFLRELRVEELQGSQGLYRVKEELLARVNAAAYPAQVKDVLFREMLVQ